MPVRNSQLPKTWEHAEKCSENRLFAPCFGTQTSRASTPSEVPTHSRGVLRRPSRNATARCVGRVLLPESLHRRRAEATLDHRSACAAVPDQCMGTSAACSRKKAHRWHFPGGGKATDVVQHLRRPRQHPDVLVCRPHFERCGTHGRDNLFAYLAHGSCCFPEMEPTHAVDPAVVRSTSMGWSPDPSWLRKMRVSIGPFHSIGCTVCGWTLAQLRASSVSLSFPRRFRQVPFISLLRVASVVRTRVRFLFSVSFEIRIPRSALARGGEKLNWSIRKEQTHFTPSAASLGRNTTSNFFWAWREYLPRRWWGQHPCTLTLGESLTVAYRRFIWTSDHCHHRCRGGEVGSQDRRSGSHESANSGNVLRHPETIEEEMVLWEKIQTTRHQTSESSGQPFGKRCQIESKGRRWGGTSAISQRNLVYCSLPTWSSR